MAARLKCVVVTPEKTALEREATFIALPLFDGEIGIAPDRAPLIGRLGFGEMRIRDNGYVERYYIDGGFVRVAGNVVSVLTGRALAAASVDREVAAEQLRFAMQRPANTPELMEIRDRVCQQARAQMRVARHA
jgi:F-type H+-transporting ATPase subunit epsilon